MNADPKLAKEIFLQALEMHDPVQWPAFLDQACAREPELRRRVEVLLEAHRKAGTAEQADVENQRPHDANAAAEQPGAIIGPYKLLEQIGEGGMGTVWMAQQTEPVKRVVALKLIKAGMDSRQVIARFEAERQALAIMDHANIARVLDAGTTDAGRPYFVMDLVKGVPITKYCDEHRLTPRQRLELFIPVCQAVQHAHQKGIIHRDLKPSNVLVAIYDGKPVPKVIDFGVAKAAGPSLTDKTLVTGFGNIIGTLEYMSPEQAEINQLDIDTRSDIYSLGILLYELLAGSPPFTRKDLEKAGVLEMLRVIREQEPSKPSTKLSTSEGLPTLAANRGTEPAKLTKLVRGELDWIVMKALEKDRGRRYETASAFAADVQRYLLDEPVHAGPPSTGYRVRKFVKRHRGPVLAAAMVMLALLAGIVGTTLGMVEAESARQDAETNAKKATDEERKAKEEERKAKALAKSEKAARNHAEWLLYATKISLALQAWESNNVVLALHYLDSCHQDFRGWEHDYLVTLFQGNQRTFAKGVNSVAVSLDGKRIFTANEDKTLTVWDADTGQAIITHQKPRGGLTNADISRDGKRIASYGSDKIVRVWDADTGNDILGARRPGGAISSVCLSPDGKRLVIGKEGGAKLGPDGKRIARSRDQTVKVWDVETGQESVTFIGQPAALNRVAWSPDGKRIAFGDGKVWDVTTGHEVLILKWNLRSVRSLAFSPDGQRIVAGDNDGAICVVDANTGKQILTFKGHTESVTCVTFDLDGKHIVSGGWDKTIKVWNANTGKETRTLKGHTGMVTNVAMMADGRSIVSGSEDKTVKAWDIHVDQGPRTLKGEVITAMSVAIMPDGKHVLRSGWRRGLMVQDPDTGQAPRILKGHPGGIVCVAVTSDGKRIISGSLEKTVKILDADTGQEILSLNGHTSQVNCVAVSSDGSRVVSGSDDKSVRVWNATTGQEVRTLNGHAGPVTSVAYSPDGHRIISGSRDQTVKVWDANTGLEIRTMFGHTGPVLSVAWTPDGKRMVSGSVDMAIKVWDADTGVESLTLKGHNGSVTSVAVMVDGQRIVSGSSDATLKVWHAATGHETLTLKGHAKVVTSVAVSRDGKRLVSGCTDGTILVWDASMSQRKP